MDRSYTYYPFLRHDYYLLLGECIDALYSTQDEPRVITIYIKHIFCRGIAFFGRRFFVLSLK